MKRVFRRLCAGACAAAVGVAAFGEPTVTETGEGARRALHVETTVDAPVDDVWRVWTTDDGFRDVFGDNRALRTDLEVGGPYEVWWFADAPEGSRGSEGCRLLSHDPGRMLSFEWNAPPKFEDLRGQRTRVALYFEPAGEGSTRLTLRHLGWGEGDRMAPVMDYFKGAWPYVLGQVESHFGEAMDTSETPGERADAPARTGWVCFLRPTREDLMATGPTPEEGAAIGEHFRRLQRLTREGVVVFAGPCTDGEGPGIVIFEAEDEAAAREIAGGDPAVEAGVFEMTLHPINFSLLRERDRG